MHTRLVALAACFAPFVVSCGSPSAPTAPPDVRGSWGAGQFASWRWSEMVVDVSRSAGCVGSLDITEQDGASFAGRYAISCPATARSAGAMVGGHVDGNGQLTFQLRAEEGWEPGLPPGWFNPPCQRAADTTYRGSVSNGTLSVRRAQRFACVPVEVDLTAAFDGTRQ
jgi:hypothetical protein